MVQHAGADNLIENLSEAPDLFDCEPVEIEVSESIFSLKIARVAETVFADVDRGHLPVRLAHGMNDGLGGAAAGDQDLARRWPLRRPKEKRHRPPTIRIAIELAMPVEVAERRRIWMALVKGAHIGGRSEGRRTVSHRTRPHPAS